MGLPSLFLIGNLVFLGLAFLYFRAYLRRRTGPERILREFRDEVDKMILEINSATDRDLSLVEERVNALKSLLDTADKRITLYQREIEKRNSRETAYAELGKRFSFRPGPAPPELPAGETVPPAAGEKSAAEEEREAAGESAARPGPRFIRSSLEVEPKPAANADKVREWFRAGFSPDIIASRLGITVAEVDTIIALSRRQEP